jgi:propionate CoA-transferase
LAILKGLTTRKVNVVKTLTAAQAAEWIADGDAVMLGGFIGSVVPEAIERAIGERSAA